MVTPICSGITLTDTKVSSVLGVISEIKKKEPKCHPRKKTQIQSAETGPEGYR